MQRTTHAGRRTGARLRGNNGASLQQVNKKNTSDGPHNETFSEVQQGRNTRVTPRSGARNSGPLTQQTESHLHTICIQCKLNKKLEDNEKTAGVCCLLPLWKLANRKKRKSIWNSLEWESIAAIHSWFSQFKVSSLRPTAPVSAQEVRRRTLKSNAESQLCVTPLISHLFLFYCVVKKSDWLCCASPCTHDVFKCLHGQTVTYCAVISWY